MSESDILERMFDAWKNLYDVTLRWVLRHSRLTLAVFAIIFAVTGWMFATMPKDFLPSEDSGQLFAFTEAAQDVSFEEMSRLQQQAAADLCAAFPEQACHHISGRVLQLRRPAPAEVLSGRHRWAWGITRGLRQGCGFEMAADSAEVLADPPQPADCLQAPAALVARQGSQQEASSVGLAAAPSF